METHPRATPAVRLLNLGCGRRFRPGWVNIDTQALDGSVLAHDVRRGIPFPDASFAFVYHSHLLEHLAPPDGRRLLHECHRVLEPGGTIRVAVPDLEQIARLYLEALDRAREGDAAWQHNYDWMMIELFDQTVRERSGGGHGAYLNRDDIPNVDFVLMRHGKEAEDSIDGQRRLREAASPVPDAGAMPRASMRSRLLSRARGMVRPFSPRRWSREARLRRLLGPEYELLELGRFRRSGEIHQWMYDGYSLSRALVEAGFESPRRVCAAESRLDGWSAWALDVDPDGRVFKPDSLYVEAIKGSPPRADRGD